MDIATLPANPDTNDYRTSILIGDADDDGQKEVYVDNLNYTQYSGYSVIYINLSTGVMAGPLMILGPLIHTLQQWPSEMEAT